MHIFKSCFRIKFFFDNRSIKKSVKFANKYVSGFLLYFLRFLMSLQKIIEGSILKLNLFEHLWNLFHYLDIFMKTKGSIYNAIVSTFQTF
jgi:hypothetical protein